MNWRCRHCLVLAVLGALTLPLFPVHAAGTFADPAFERQWREGEAIAPNFWGPLANARDGRQERYAEARQRPYGEAQEGLRIVQYFDKGRMELTNGVVTNGLLAAEMVAGRIQTGDAISDAMAPPTIPIAGDADNPGPTYAQLGDRARQILDAAPRQTGDYARAALSGSGELSVSDAGQAPDAQLVVYDGLTRHNVARAFADYRDLIGVATVGLAISEPVFTTVRVAGVPQAVLVQIFERRVLTDTGSNPDGFKVEMGNTGRQYYRWRYGMAP